MSLYLLDKSLKVEIYYDEQDSEYDDNICISFLECCPEDEQIFRAGETNIYLTPDEARQLARLLTEAADSSTR